MTSPSVARGTSPLVPALKWSVLSELTARAIQPLVFLILARFLVPSDYGVMSAAQMTIALSQVLWDAGLAKAIVQRRENIDIAASVAFWLNCGLAVAVALGLILLSKTIATGVYHDPRVALVLQALSVQTILGALGSVHTALLQRELAFKKLFWARVVTSGLPALISIPLALLGMGYWALVAGALVGQAAQTTVLWIVSRWRPMPLSRSLNRMVLTELVRFGFWVQLAGLLGWFFGWADALVVGIRLGSHDLGLYRTGTHLIVTMFGVLLGPVTPVLYSLLCRMNGDPAALRAATDRIVAILTLVTIPLGLAASALASPIAGTLFGAPWRGLDGVIMVMAALHGVSWIVGMNGEIYRASGRPSLETIVNIVMVPVYLAAYWISAPHGLDTFLWTRLLLALAATLGHLLLLRRVLGAPVLPKLLHATVIAAAVGLPARWIAAAISGTSLNAWVSLAISSLAIAVVVAAVLLLAGARRRWRDFVELGRDLRETP